MCKYCEPTERVLQGCGIDGMQSIVTADVEPLVDVGEETGADEYTSWMTSEMYVDVSSNVLHVEATINYITEIEDIPINYCPMCGRDLRRGKHV